MKTTITALALGLMLSGTAFAETAKPIKPAKLDTITTQSIELQSDQLKCGQGFADFKTMKACGNANAYPANPLSGMNLGY
jgi:hypothetical protein